ncbi:hypothetical protein SAMD00019534_040120, partial [Acytostelium subglobosum LB1]|uniref:hypothetical protein n=1 Tax=Acytostelium subglobosum LB1 TaxID=1410327 RepID=UPI0006452297
RYIFYLINKQQQRMTNVNQPQFYQFGCNLLQYLKQRYSSAVIKADTNLFVEKLKNPSAITVGDAKRVAGTAVGMAGFFYAGEVYGKNSIVGYWPGYDIDVHTELNRRE